MSTTHTAHSLAAERKLLDALAAHESAIQVLANKTNFLQNTKTLTARTLTRLVANKRMMVQRSAMSANVLTSACNAEGVAEDIKANTKIMAHCGKKLKKTGISPSDAAKQRESVTKYKAMIQLQNECLHDLCGELKEFGLEQESDSDSDDMNVHEVDAYRQQLLDAACEAPLPPANTSDLYLTQDNCPKDVSSEILKKK